MGYGFLALYLTVPWSFGALLVGSTLAFLIGRALRTESRRWVHETVFGAFGLIVGVLTTVIAVWPGRGSDLDHMGGIAGWWWYAAIVAASACPAVLFGWRYAARDAVGKAPQRPRKLRPDPDAEYEDSISQ